MSSSVRITLEDSLIIIGINSDNGAAEGCIIAACNMFEWMEWDEVRKIYAENINNNLLDDLDLIYFPGGSIPPYRRDITNTGRQNLRNRIQAGFGYIGTCAGGLIACEKSIWEDYEDNVGLFKLYPVTGMGLISEIFQYPEVGMCQVNFITHSMTNMQSDSGWILYHNSPYFQIHESSNVDIIGRYEISGHPAIVATNFGNGRILLTGPHYEFEEDSHRDGVSNFDHFQDHGSDWPLMKAATKWCLKLTN
jgi:glutamine amidotransferase-like uncharacterized protein